MKRTIKAVRIDETQYWLLDIQRKVSGRIYGVYLYDEGERTYCCEITPSYYLMFAYNEVAGECSDETAEQITLEQSEDMYMHCRDVESLQSVPIEIEIDDDDLLEDNGVRKDEYQTTLAFLEAAREQVQANWVGF